MPAIAPFSFGEDEFNIDEYASATCSISKGDLPVKIFWSFNGGSIETQHNLTSDDGVAITRNSPRMSMLVLDAVKGRHRGNYTCNAQNRAGIASYSSYLSINGHWIFHNCNQRSVRIGQILQFVFLTADTFHQFSISNEFFINFFHFKCLHKYLHSILEKRSSILTNQSQQFVPWARVISH